MLMFLLLLVFIVNVGILVYFQKLSSLQILFWDKFLYLIVGHGKKKKLNGFFPKKKKEAFSQKCIWKYLCVQAVQAVSLQCSTAPHKSALSGVLP